jgi:hypothetical protein
MTPILEHEILGEYFMIFLLFSSWYYVIRKHFKIEKICPQGEVVRW